MKILGSEKSYSCETNQTKQTNTPLSPIHLLYSVQFNSQTEQWCIFLFICAWTVIYLKTWSMYAVLAGGKGEFW